MHRALVAAIAVVMIVACADSSDTHRLPDDATYADLVAEYPDEAQRFNDALSALIEQAPANLPDLSTAPAADDVLSQWACTAPNPPRRAG